jgi:hypothetical protein
MLERMKRNRTPNNELEVNWETCITQVAILKFTYGFNDILIDFWWKFAH